MKLIYVAGKYTGKTFSEIDDNIYKAEKVSIQLLKHGWAVHTPHKNTAHYEIYEDLLGFTHQDWLNMDFEILKRCDAVFFMKDWQKSKGAKMEYDFAKKQDIKIFFEKDGYPDWRDLK